MELETFYFVAQLKVLTTIFVLLSLGIGLFQNAIPYAEYWLNKDYIASQLCVEKDDPESACKGQCQLMKRLKKSEEKQRSPVVLARYNWEYVEIEVLNLQYKQILLQEEKHDGFFYQFISKTALRDCPAKPPELMS